MRQTSKQDQETKHIPTFPPYNTPPKKHQLFLQASTSPSPSPKKSQTSKKNTTRPSASTSPPATSKRQAQNQHSNPTVSLT
ncbi:hypothetical protein P280DRAFT_466884 [Massarina eburnea CBS 473.64]|uniref:Uncharacterized protein n=1 Tax=Massarina eburnea CBS 473.64 TaxID=1395130 RepID=A0A6A6SBK8_9PLEO|nr:hypothetical protein P280DRAFT_466884 [Massarina eburnea CBS 473.64]